MTPRARLAELFVQRRQLAAGLNVPLGGLRLFEVPKIERDGREARARRVPRHQRGWELVAQAQRLCEQRLGLAYLQSSTDAS